MHSFLLLSSAHSSTCPWQLYGKTSSHDNHMLSHPVSRRNLKKMCFNSGPISLSDSWCRGKLGINTAGGTWLMATCNCLIRWVLILSRNCIGFDPLHGQQADNIRRSILKTQLLLCPSDHGLLWVDISHDTLDIFEDDGKHGFLPTFGFPFLPVFESSQF